MSWLVHESLGLKAAVETRSVDISRHINTNPVSVSVFAIMRSLAASSPLTAHLLCARET